MPEPPRKPSQSFLAVKDILDRERTETPSAGTESPVRIQAWQMLLEVEADPASTSAERKLARALRLLLSRTHGP